MWRLIYLVLLLVRIYFAVCPSYLHPDENFQGPEVIAGELYSYPSRRTWEWTSSTPIRSIFPLWPVYGLPIALLQSVWRRNKGELVDATVIYYTLRMVMFTFSFVLEDWAIYELVHSLRQRRQSVILVASSYVTWTFQTHTFSNSIETLLVLWSLVLIERISSEKKRSLIAASVVLGFVLVFGTFNRITFPAFVLIPGLQLLPHFLNRPFCFLALTISMVFWIFMAVATDTVFYVGDEAADSFRALFDHICTKPIITPINNIMYNTQTSNLAEHGLHPHYQHVLANLPQLLGPAFLLLCYSTWPVTRRQLLSSLKNPRITSAITAVIVLSLIPHQEARFLIPCVPLLLTCVRLPVGELSKKIFWTSWIIFNLLLGLLMGQYHQGGIVPAQIAMSGLVTESLGWRNSDALNVEVFWWKTYPPPTYLLGNSPKHPRLGHPLNISTVPLMGIPQSELVFMLMQHMPTCDPDLIERLSPHSTKTEIYVAAPLSAWRLSEPYPSTSNFSFSIEFDAPPAVLGMTNLAVFRNHLNLDDLDFGDDGVVDTLSRVVGRRGLGVWKVDRLCFGPVLQEEGISAYNFSSL